MRMIRRMAGSGLAVAVWVLMMPWTAFSAFDAAKAGFTVKYKDETSAYRINAVFLMPGENLVVAIKGADKDGYTLTYTGGSGGPSARHEWNWKAPDSSGLYPMTVSRDGFPDSIRLNVFVMVPAGELRGEYLRGYHIGKYPSSPLKGLDFYRAPKGYVELDERTAQAWVSPHFRLSQFVCKQTAGPPAYLALKERLILKLETLLEKVNEEGYACPTFHVMSGYRTPFYNKSIGNVKFSAHQWGGAADIFIDANPEDGQMDDLNGDGKVDGKDSEVLFKIVDRMSLNEFFLPYLGGVGKYSRSESHGPFVHVDVRGFRAVW
jgi:Peptidase M15